MLKIQNKQFPILFFFRLPADSAPLSIDWGALVIGTRYEQVNRMTSDLGCISNGCVGKRNRTLSIPEIAIIMVQFSQLR